MPAGQGEDEERFAAATEFGSPPGADAREELAHELALAAALDRSRASLSPDPETSARMRARLFAALAEEQGGGEQDGPPPPPAPSAGEQTAPLAAVPTPHPTARPAAEIPGASDPTAELSVVEAAEPTAAETTVALGHGVPHGGRARHKMPSRAVDRPRGSRGSRRPGAASARRRVGIIGVAALAVMVALAGAGTFFSRDALPGDTLYGVKRVAESAGLAMTFGDEAKARRQLDLASTRLSEIEQLVSRQRTSAPDPQLLEATISAFDSAASEGSRMLLGGQQVPGADGLGDLRTWAAQQAARLAALRSALPTPALPDADQSMALLERMAGRAEALRMRMSCNEVTSGVVDDLGPVPAEGACTPKVGPNTPAREAGNNQSSRVGSSTSQSNGNSPAPSAPGSPSASSVPGGEGGLLPGVGPENNPLGNPALPGGAAPSTSASIPAPGAPASVPAPLPLLPPIQLPPLLPGMPGITIG